MPTAGRFPIAAPCAWRPALACLLSAGCAPRYCNLGIPATVGVMPPVPVAGPLRVCGRPHQRRQDRCCGVRICAGRQALHACGVHQVGTNEIVAHEQAALALLPPLADSQSAPGANLGHMPTLSDAWLPRAGLLANCQPTNRPFHASMHKAPLPCFHAPSAPSTPSPAALSRPSPTRNSETLGRSLMWVV